MKRLTAVLVALGFSAAAFAGQYDEIASGSALPAGESAYGFSMSDPYTDGTIIVHETIVAAPDVIVLVPIEDSVSSSHIPG
jgi:hypothetical protein